jgi:hypothetical protein
VEEASGIPRVRTSGQLRASIPTLLREITVSRSSDRSKRFYAHWLKILGKMTRQSRNRGRVRPSTWTGAAETVAAFLGSAAVAGFALDTLNSAAGYPLPGAVVAVAGTLLATGAGYLFVVRSWAV